MRRFFAILITSSHSKTNRVKALLVLSLAMALTACSLYTSQGRKYFESHSDETKDPSGALVCVPTSDPDETLKQLEERNSAKLEPLPEGSGAQDLADETESKTIIKQWKLTYPDGHEDRVTLQQSADTFEVCHRPSPGATKD
jgi:hypothetical protein